MLRKHTVSGWPGKVVCEAQKIGLLIDCENCDFIQAMGNFPYPSTYILNGGGEMPAYPVRVACESLADEAMATDELLSGFADSLGIFYNYTKVHTQGPESRFRIWRKSDGQATPLLFQLGRPSKGQAAARSILRRKHEYTGQQHHTTHVCASEVQLCGASQQSVLLW